MSAVVIEDNLDQGFGRFQADAESALPIAFSQTGVQQEYFDALGPGMGCARRRGVPVSDRNGNGPLVLRMGFPYLGML